VGVHRATGRWWSLLRRHLLLASTAAAVLLVTAAVTFASRPTGHHGAGSGRADRGAVTGAPAGGPSTPAVIDDLASREPGASGDQPSTPAAASRAQSPTGGPSRSAAGPTGGQTTAPPAPNGAFSATYQISSAWTGGYVATIAITNSGPVAATWTLELRLPATASLVTGWNAAFATSGTAVTATPEQGRPLAAGATVDVGYLANRTDERTTPVACAVNGRACQ
jgi:cellulase/cellobiase CelA1